MVTTKGKVINQLSQSKVVTEVDQLPLLILPNQTWAPNKSLLQIVPLLVQLASCLPNEKTRKILSGWIWFGWRDTTRHVRGQRGETTPTPSFLRRNVTYRRRLPLRNQHICNFSDHFKFCGDWTAPATYLQCRHKCSTRVLVSETIER